MVKPGDRYDIHKIIVRPDTNIADEVTLDQIRGLRKLFETLGLPIEVTTHISFEVYFESFSRIDFLLLHDYIGREFEKDIVATHARGLEQMWRNNKEGRAEIMALHQNFWQEALQFINENQPQRYRRSTAAYEKLLAHDPDFFELLKQQPFYQEYVEAYGRLRLGRFRQTVLYDDDIIVDPPRPRGQALIDCLKDTGAQIGIMPNEQIADPTEREIVYYEELSSCLYQPTTGV